MKFEYDSPRCASSDLSTFENPQEIYPVLAEIFEKTFPFFLAIGGLVLAASLYRAVVQSGWVQDFFLHVGLYLTAGMIFVFHRRFPIPVVFSALLGIGYVLAIKSLFDLGLAGTGMLNLVIFCTFAGVFLGKRAGMITLIFGAGTAAIIGAGICTGVITTRSEIDKYLVSPSKWILQISFYLMYLVPLILSVNGLHKRMFLSLKKLKINNLQLEAEISMRRQAEEALRKSEARLRQVIDLVPHYIYARDRHGRFILANQATANGFGTTVEDLIGKTDTDFNRNKKEVEQFLRDDLEVLRGGLPKEISEEKVTDSKGNICILHTIKIPYTVSSSGGEAVLAVSTDITRRKRAEEKSKESECRFREFADLLPQAVAEFDLMGNFTYGNLYGFAMFGYTQQEFDARTRNFSEMFVPQDLERLGSCIQKIFEGGKGSVNNEYTAKRKDGSVFPVMLYASPVLRGGKPAGWRAIACDITDEKRSNRP